MSPLVVYVSMRASEFALAVLVVFVLGCAAGACTLARIVDGRRHPDRDAVQ